MVKWVDNQPVFDEGPGLASDMRNIGWGEGSPFFKMAQGAGLLPQGPQGAQGPGGDPFNGMIPGDHTMALLARRAQEKAQMNKLERELELRNQYAIKGKEQERTWAKEDQAAAQKRKLDLMRQAGLIPGASGVAPNAGGDAGSISAPPAAPGAPAGAAPGSTAAMDGIPLTMPPEGAETPPASPQGPSSGAGATQAPGAGGKSTFIDDPGYKRAAEKYRQMAVLAAADPSFKILADQAKAEMDAYKDAYNKRNVQSVEEKEREKLKVKREGEKSLAERSLAPLQQVFKEIRALPETFAGQGINFFDQIGPYTSAPFGTGIFGGAYGAVRGGDDYHKVQDRVAQVENAIKMAYLRARPEGMGPLSNDETKMITQQAGNIAAAVDAKDFNDRIALAERVLYSNLKVGNPDIPIPGEATASGPSPTQRAVSPQQAQQQGSPGEPPKRRVPRSNSPAVTISDPAKVEQAFGIAQKELANADQARRADIISDLAEATGMDEADIEQRLANTKSLDERKQERYQATPKGLAGAVN